MENFYQENKWAIWLIGISLIAIGIIAYFVFRTPSGQIKPKVTVSVSAPQQTASGQEVVYKIGFSNADTNTITGVTMDLVYPSGFTFEDSSPKPSTLDGSEFNLPDLAPGQNGTIMIKGILSGNAGETKSVNVVMHYKFSNFNSDFVAQAQGQSQIVNSNVALQFGGPTQTNNDQNLNYTLTYTNTTQNTLSGLKLNVTIPSNFMVSSYNPNPDQANTWNIASLTPGQSGIIQLAGKFSNAPVGNQQIFAAEIDGPDSNSSSSQLVTYSNSTYAVNIGTVPLATTLTVQDQSSGSSANSIVNPGDTLNYTVNYQNNNTIAMTGVVVTVKLDGSAYDLTSINTSNGTVSQNVITWDGSLVKDLNTLNPGQSGNLTFVVRVKNPAVRDNSTNLTLTAHSEIKSNEIQQPFVGPDITMKVETSVQVASSVAYSTGPLPPKAGQSTGYVVTVGLKNSTNSVSNGVMTMNLPNIQGFDITSVNSAEQGNVKFDQNSKKLTWTVGTLNAHTGDFSAMRKLQFVVHITPNVTSVGQPMTLVNNISFAGNDDFTQQPINVTADNISTLNDPSGNGIVSQ